MSIKYKRDGYKKEDITNKVLNFIKTYDREPTSNEYSNKYDLPSARTIQRLYGGLPQFREQLGLKNIDFTKGTLRQMQAIKSMETSKVFEYNFYKDCRNFFGEDKVSTPVRVFINSAKTLDLRIDMGEYYLLIDVFSPKDKSSLDSCIRIKTKKYDVNEESYYLKPVKIIFVSTNEDIVFNTKCPFELFTIESFKKKYFK